MVLYNFHVLLYYKSIHGLSVYKMFSFGKWLFHNAKVVLPLPKNNTMSISLSPVSFSAVILKLFLVVVSFRIKLLIKYLPLSISHAHRFGGQPLPMALLLSCKIHRSLKVVWAWHCSNGVGSVTPFLPSKSPVLTSGFSNWVPTSSSAWSHAGVAVASVLIPVS